MKHPLRRMSRIGLGLLVSLSLGQMSARAARYRTTHLSQDAPDVVGAFLKEQKNPLNPAGPAFADWQSDLPSRDWRGTVIYRPLADRNSYALYAIDSTGRWITSAFSQSDAYLTPQPPEPWWRIGRQLRLQNRS